MRGSLIGSLSLSLTLLGAAAHAQELNWRPSLGRPVAIAATAEPSTENTPVVTLVRPVAIAPVHDESSARVASEPGSLRPVSFQDADAAPRVVRGQMSDPAAPRVSVPMPDPILGQTPAEQYNCGVANQNPAAGTGFWDKTKGFFVGLTTFGKTDTRHLFESDHAFDDFASPVSNPFLFEDPRSLTELRPIYIHQGTAANNWVFHGGDVEFFAMQGRLAITDWFSIVVNKLGVVWSEPHDGFMADFQNHVGFAEINVGPKFTFLRNESTGTLGAFGLNFEIPTGSGSVQQNTGSLSLGPYLSMGQRFGHIPSYGTFHALGTIGYNVATDNVRSDNLFLSLHLDFDVGDLHKIYPLIELNWFHYTSNGKDRDLNFEGRDLFNFGSTQVSGHDDVSLALGVRYKFNQYLNLGLAVEFPITGRKDIMDYRVTFDAIFRY